GHGFMTFSGQRMSKSLGTAIDPIEAADRLGPEPLRLFVIKEIAFGADGDFSWERYDERYNVDLANNLGNLVSRVAAMAHRYRQGRLSPSGAASDVLARSGDAAVAAYREAMDSYALHDGAAAAFHLIDATNQFITETAPWQMAKDRGAADRLTQVLFDAAEAIRVAAILLTPIMPASAAEILKRVGARSDEPLRLERDGRWRHDGERTLTQQAALWPRKEQTTVTDQPTSRPSSGPAPAPAAAPAPPAPAAAANPTTPASTAPATAADGDRIPIDDFMKGELRDAKILTAQRVPNSKRLLTMQVGVGGEERTIGAGIDESYEPAALGGRQGVVVANLKPAKLMGVESNGMLLAASPDGGRPIVVTFDEAPAPGTRVR